MESIHLKNMEFYAFVGHFEEEQIVGTNFLVDLTMETAMEAPARTDELDDALDYQRAYQVVNRVMKKKAKLLEHVASNILDDLFKAFPGLLIKATVKVSKLNPPLGGGKVEAVCVEMERETDD